MIALGRKYGEASKLRILKDGSKYVHLFEKAPGKVYTIKRNAGLSDTVKFIPQVVQQTYQQTFKVAQQECKGSSVYDTCRKTWQFVYDHIQYRKDKQGYEQIRSPRRTWHDRVEGVDCDCYSVFISSIFTNLDIPHILRITKYTEDHFQHIYPVVPFNGRYIIIDCVTDHFDFEVPFSAKKDYPMDLQFLDGIPEYEIGFGELGKLKKKNKGVGGSTPAKKKKGLFSKLKKGSPVSSGTSSSPKKKKKKGIFKKIGSAVKKINVKNVVSKINKINPAAVALRNGVLAAMKLNVKNIAARLYWSYQSPEQAAAGNIDISKLNALIKTRKKLESIFETAGGKIKNLEKAIRKGKEHSVKHQTKKLNRKARKLNRSMSGVDDLEGLYDDQEYGISLYDDLETVLGSDIYNSENVEGLDGVDALESLGELGEPVTLATVGAAMGVLAGIISQLKQIGNIFKGKSEGSDDFDEAKNAAAENNEPVPGTTAVPESATPAILPEQATLPDTNSDNNTDTSSSSAGNQDDSGIKTASDGDTDHGDDTDSSNDDSTNDEDAGSNTNANLQVAKTADNSVTKTDNKGDDKDNFWKKPWVKPTAVIGGSLLLVLIAAKVLGGSHEKNKSSPPGRSLDGIPKRKNHRRKKHKKQLAAIELL